MMKRSFLLIIMMISAFSLFSFENNKAKDEAKTSYASYYHDKFNGRKTANGEIFSNAKFTAAHKTLPFGSLVKVTNLKTGLSTIVRINDRGPYHSARALDLSKVAFDEIGNLAKGTMPIEYEVLK